MVVINCTIDGCGWQTEDRDVAIFGEILAAELSNHTQGSHVVKQSNYIVSLGSPVVTPGKYIETPATASRLRPAPPPPAKLVKPSIGLDSTLENYNYFSERWKTYKAATEVTGDELCGHLLDCAEEPLRQAMYRDNANIEKLDEDAIMVAIRRLAVPGQKAGIEENDAKKSKSTEGNSAKFKEILMTFALCIIMPTIDVFSDLGLAWRYYTEGSSHPRFAAIVITPFLVNYMLTWVAWWRIEDNNRHITWIPTALACYPQYRAAMVIWHLCKNMDKGLAKKRVLEREISELEIFTEAVPSTLILTCLMVTGFMARYTSRGGDENFNEIYKLILGDTSYKRKKFWFTFATSIISASLGLAKCLKVGPCRVVEPQGGLSCLKVLLLALGMGFTLAGKGMTIGFAMYSYEYKKTDWNTHIKFNSFGVWAVPFPLATMFIPGLLLSLLSLCHYKGAIKNILAHPSLLLLPVFTHFTFSFQPMCCSSRGHQGRVQWSMPCTLVNIFISSLGHCAFTTVFAMVSRSGHWFGYLNCIPVPIVGMFLTMIFCCIDTCLCSSCCSSAIPVGVLVPKEPFTEFVVGKDNELVSMDEWRRTQETC